MLETSARLLRLLTLLQTRRDWSGAELARRLGVSTRTVRRDVDKLRGLDYPVEVGMGTTGGYRLGAGAELPPLLLDDDEAVAVAVTLRTAAGAGVAGLGETALRALMKLEQVLPSRLRHRVAAVPVSTVNVPGEGPSVDAAVLTAVGAACRDRRRLRFDYRTFDGSLGAREADPHHLVSWSRRWYLVAWDLDRDDWRTFRVDRLVPRLGPDGLATGPRFEPREVPGGDPAAFVSDRVADVWPSRARVRVSAPADVVAAGLWTVHAKVEEIDAHSCLLHIGAESPRIVAFLLTVLDADFVVESPPALADEVRRLAERYRRAVPAG